MFLYQVQYFFPPQAHEETTASASAWTSAEVPMGSR
jgi:hypothetical protein